MMHPSHIQYDYALSQDIAKAIIGEYHAINYYADLIALAPDQATKEVFHEIRQDEIKHYHSFLPIYQRLTGQNPQIPSGPRPTNLEEGIKFAIRDELETVDFYNTIADKAHDPMIREAFRRAALDEQQHAGWFTYKWIELFK